MFSISKEERLKAELVRIKEREAKEAERKIQIAKELAKMSDKSKSIFGPQAQDVGASHPSLHVDRGPFMISTSAAAGTQEGTGIVSVPN